MARMDTFRPHRAAADTRFPWRRAPRTRSRAGFTVTRAATDVTGKVGEMKQITVSITWRGIDGQSHVRTSTTHYCKEGLYAYYYTKARS